MQKPLLTPIYSLSFLFLSNSVLVPEVIIHTVQSCYSGKQNQKLWHIKKQGFKEGGKKKLKVFTRQFLIATKLGDRIPKLKWLFPVPYQGVHIVPV